MGKQVLLIGFLLVLMLVGLTGVFLWRCSDDWCLTFDWQKARVADSFDRCLQLGFPVMESYPRKCAVNGKTFTESVPPITLSPNATISVTAPTLGGTIISPFVVRGEAPGTWYFEATFPVTLFDGNGKAITVTYATAKSDWMTTALVPFEATLTFEAPVTATGILLLKKNNPTDLSQYDDSVSIPVRFEQSSVQPEAEGALEGTMTIGPICPVELVGEPCSPTAEMYAARKVFVFSKDRKKLIKTLTPDAQGKFRTTLPGGTYVIDMEPEGIGGINGVPATVSIVPGKSVSLVIDVDTGIR
ncbi:MAG: hypothetical protein A2942_04835 [Candidatus Lloydbacteria bacterium RIFCSPLOWO2_01_FULL_50_20]|uniref:Bacterial spore germination immunoglobulin-like domain-containing protein n=1 Tax=Candidatus Lloydbacteria bacterium RIFCSPLOWO2_01_FULL_50_20 TaxID=1798665 RepID=A0A1G2DDI7_9BACT|nr:MAG: hypothetical protein A3C13_02310 [Candidatus Lloydbacteria bacterium RIFCSPHIGHO2_02_FULL_50_11]OGZ11695.1 MAG: hypothetical protein A2942_04835 [Candidatus Lloydbacteria bacterium RIFCSPLOWO2_01_FULL_50_20]